MAERRRVFLTGGTGAWGRRVLEQLRAADYDVTALVLPTQRDRDLIQSLAWNRLRVVEGDLTDYAAVQRCVSDADVVLHVGAVVSPLADEQPELARRVNVGAMENIVRAVREHPSPGSVSVVGVGSVAETGDRQAPVHWGRVGDPIRVSHFDEYGQTKVEAERLLVESGLPRWTWLRQTGIFHPAMLEIRDPIMTHSPLTGVMEWVSAEDSARLLVGLCDPAAPEDVWGEVWNIGGGAGWRLTNWELQLAIARTLGVKDLRRWYDRNWFATRNFHGQWYTDSDDLHELVPFRADRFADALARAERGLSRTVKIAGRVPPGLIRRFVMEPITKRPRGTMAYLAAGDTEGIDAFFGSVEEWRAIGDWSTFTVPEPSRTPSKLDHGYDESRRPEQWTRDDIAGAARFRGGELLSPHLPTAHERAQWRCAEGHAFAASPFLILRAGHWCPTCVRDTTRYRDLAQRNPFLAQVELA